MKEIKELSFDEAMTQLEEKISLLEKEENTDNQTLYEEAVALKEHCAELLKKEKEEIKRIAKENNIPLSEIGMTDEDGDEDSTESSKL